MVTILGWMFQCYLLVTSLMTVAEAQCNTTTGEVIGANNIGTVEVNSIADCCAACNQNSACKAFTYDTSGGNPHACYLKDNTEDSGPNPDRVSGYRSAPPPPPEPSVLCNQSPQSGYPFCNTSLPIEQRVTDLVNRLTLAEKIQQTWSVAPAISRLGINAYNWRSNCLHGWTSSGGSWPSGTYWTVFPAPIGLSATFDNPLILQLGQITSDEGRALHNVQLARMGGTSPEAAGLNCFSPNVNLFRHPLWGRGQETFGEDPYLVSNIGAMYSMGIQNGEDPNYVKVVACPKHYVAHSGPENSRSTFTSVVNLHDLYDTYLPQFEANVRCAKAGQLMPAYSSLKCPGSEDGAPDCANPFILRQILRTQYGVPNISIISDNGAVDQVYSTHHYVNSYEMAAAVTMNASTDLDLGNDAVYSKYLGPAVSDGLVTESTISESVWRSFYWRMKVGDFDPVEKVPYQSIGADHLNTKANQDVNLLSSEESLVLLKNLHSNSLPLAASSIKKLAVIGPLAFSANPYLSNYQGIPDPNQMIPISKGLQTYVPATSTTTAPGCPSTQCPNTSDISAAVTAATGADVAVLVLGLDGSIEAEGKDRTAYPCEGVLPDALALPGCQLNLLKAVGAVTKVILVLIHGGPVTIPDALNSDYVIGVIDAFYPGPRGGDAVARAIFGDYNPGGRLPTTMYQTSKDIPAITNYDMTTSPGFTYKWYSGANAPLLPFGFGLSYTTFSYANLVVSATTVTICTPITVNFTISNTGSRTGDEVVQLYVAPPKPTGYIVPKHSLQGYRRIRSLAAGGRSSQSFTISAYSMHTVDNNGNRYVQPGAYTFYIGSQQPGANLTGFLTGSFTLTGSATLVSDCKGAPITYVC